MLVFIMCYEFIQGSFKYRFHADSIQKDPVKAVRLCKLITICVEAIYLILCNNLDVSIYYHLLIILTIAFINCIVEFCLEHLMDKYSMLKDKDTLIYLCNVHNLTEDAKDRMIMKYIDGKSYKEIADIYCVDEDTIRKSINRSRHKILKD